MEEGGGDLLELPVRLRGPEVNSGAHGHGAHVPGLLDRAEQDLVIVVGVGHELVVVELADEWDAVRVPAGAPAPPSGGPNPRVSFPLRPQLGAFLAVAVYLGWGEPRTRGVF